MCTLAKIATVLLVNSGEVPVMRVTKGTIDTGNSMVARDSVVILMREMTAAVAIFTKWAAMVIANRAGLTGRREVPAAARGMASQEAAGIEKEITIVIMANHTMAATATAGLPTDLYQPAAAMIATGTSPVVASPTWGAITTGNISAAVSTGMTTIAPEPI